jgi:hypothetical protein
MRVSGFRVQGPGFSQEDKEREDRTREQAEVDKKQSMLKDIMVPRTLKPEA